MGDRRAGPPRASGVRWGNRTRHRRTRNARGGFLSRRFNPVGPLNLDGVVFSHHGESHRDLRARLIQRSFSDRRANGSREESGSLCSFLLRADGGCNGPWTRLRLGPNSTATNKSRPSRKQGIPHPYRSWVPVALRSFHVRSLAVRIHSPRGPYDGCAKGIPLQHGRRPHEGSRSRTPRGGVNLTGRKATLE